MTTDRPRMSPQAGLRKLSDSESRCIVCDETRMHVPLAEPVEPFKARLIKYQVLETLVENHGRSPQAFIGSNHTL